MWCIIQIFTKFFTIFRRSYLPCARLIISVFCALFTTLWSLFAAPSYALEIPPHWDMLTYSHVVNQLERHQRFDHTSLSESSLKEGLDTVFTIEKLLASQRDTNTPTSINPLKSVENALINDTLASLRYGRYGGTKNLGQNALWASMAGELSSSTQLLYSDYIDTLDQDGKSDLRAFTFEETLWGADLVHMLAVLDVYISHDAPIADHPNGLLMSFAGDMLSCVIDDQMAPESLGTDVVSSFDRKDFLANLHGTLLAGLYQQLRAEVKSSISLTELLNHYDKIFSPNYLAYERLWIVSLHFQMGGMDNLMNQVNSLTGLEGEEPHLISRLFIEQALREDTLLSYDVVIHRLKSLSPYLAKRLYLY